MADRSYIQAKALQLFNQNPDAVVCFDLNLRVTLWNQNAEELFGYEVPEVMGAHILDIITPDGGMARDLEDFRKCISGEKVVQHAVSRKSKEDGWKVITSTLIPVSDDSGIFSGIVVLRDHTQEHRELEVLGEAFSIAKMASWQILVEDSLVFAPSKELFGLLAIDGEATMDLIAFLNLFNNEDAARFKENVEHAVSEGLAGSIDLRSFQLPNSTKAKSYRISWEVERHQQVTVRIFGVIQDISDDIEREEKIERQRVLLMGKNRLTAIGELSAGIAHEVNNPMAIISGAIRMLSQRAQKDDLEPNHIEDLIDKMNFACQRVTSIISNLRKFASESENKDFEKINLKDLVDSTLELCKERIDSHDVKLEVSGFADDSWVACRSSEISQVLFNLINNALDAIFEDQKAGSWITITSNIRSDGYIELAVSDSGAGIPKEVQEKIMEPFFTTKPIGKGTGLGLSLSLGIMSDHKGDLYLDTDSNHTRFIMLFPPYGKLLEKDAA